MEVLENPLNLAHQWGRKADRLLAAGRYDEAVSCHGEAADLLKEAMKLTQCEQARLSMELQKNNHVKELRLIKEKQKRARSEGKPRSVKSATAPERDPSRRACDSKPEPLRDRGTSPRPPGPSARAPKDDKTRLEEQQTTIADLRKLVDFLLTENEKLARENRHLQAQNVRLRSEPRPEPGAKRWVRPLSARDVPVQRLPPSGLPDRDVSLEALPALELPEDIEHDLQELVGRDLL